MQIIFAFISTLLTMLSYVIFAHVILFWLLQLGVVNLKTEFVARLWAILNSILEPFYTPIRRFVPPIGNIDSAPLVMIFGIFVLQTFFRAY